MTMCYGTGKYVSWVKTVYEAEQRGSTDLETREMLMLKTCAQVFVNNNLNICF